MTNTKLAFICGGAAIVIIMIAALLIFGTKTGTAKLRSDVPDNCLVGSPTSTFIDSSTGHTVVLYDLNCS